MLHSVGHVPTADGLGDVFNLLKIAHIDHLHYYYLTTYA